MNARKRETKKPRRGRGLRTRLDSRHRARAAGAFGRRRALIDTVIISLPMKAKSPDVNELPDPVPLGAFSRAMLGLAWLGLASECLEGQSGPDMKQDQGEDESGRAHMED